MNQRELQRRRSFGRRAAILAGGKLALMSVLGARLYYLQIVEGERYRLLAEENRINLRLLAPPRGRIFDRAGVELAGNRQIYRLLLVAEQAGDLGATLDAVAQFVPLGPEERARIAAEVARKRKFVPVILRERLSWKQAAEIEINAPYLPGVSIEAGQTRHYPVGAPLAHLVGYVAAVSADELSGDPLLELPDFRIGKSGVERWHDLRMRGRAGNQEVEINAHGRVIRELSRNESEPGNDVSLTVDAGLQAFTAARLGEESAAAAVLDVASGDVLALASTPSFDPDAFNRGVSRPYWEALVDDARAPLTNKAISGQYPPGSTFKPIVALAGLEAGVVGPSYMVHCPGYMDVGGRRFHCWKRGGHGRQTMVEAIAESCDVYFYDIALRIGIERIAEMARRFGLGRPTGLDLPGEATGLMPTPDWKFATRGVEWQQGETVNTGVGQGFVLATPLQLAVMAARFANGGGPLVPRLVRPTGGPAEAAAPAEASDLSPASLDIVRAGMRAAVNHRRGTAFQARIENRAMAMAGKTGTSQVRRISMAERAAGVVKNEDRPWKDRDHALFVAYAPVDDPRYAAAVVIEHGGSGGQAAAPIARDILIETQRRAAASAAPLAGEAPAAAGGEA